MGNTSVLFDYRPFSSSVQAKVEKCPTKSNCRKKLVLRGKVLFVNTVQSEATKMICVPAGYWEHDRKAVNRGTQELEKG